MNKYKVKVKDYKLALDNYIIYLDIEIKNEIDRLVIERKKPKFFGLLTFNDYEVTQYKNELLNENKHWNVLDEEFFISKYRWKINETKNKIKSLDLIQEDTFITDDKTLEFIQKYKV